MASGGSLVCFLCDKNPRLPGDFVCKSCKEESRFCYECGQRERNHPFKLCAQCYSEQQQQQQRKRNRTPMASPKVPVLATTTQLTCKLPGCTKPRYTEDNGRVHDFCSRSHAKEYSMQDRVVEQKNILFHLEHDQNTYKEIAEHFKKEWVKVTPACPKPPVPAAIFAIQNEELNKQFRQYGKEIRKEGKTSNSDLFFHGTTLNCSLLTNEECCQDVDCGICGISQTGFDSSRIGTNIPRFQRFGSGIYLAPNSSKCHDYTQGMPEHGLRAQLLCLVAQGAKHELMQDHTKLLSPPKDCHSVYGKAGGSLNYDEIVVFDPSAVLPQYIILYEQGGVDKIAK